MSITVNVDKKKNMIVQFPHGVEYPIIKYEIGYVKNACVPSHHLVYLMFLHLFGLFMCFLLIDM